MISRRNILTGGGAVLAASLIPLAANAKESNLIYLSPLQSNGRLSRCQAEVWYVEDAGASYVVTASDAWRARAVGMGLTRTQVWVGDVGNWSRSAGGYKKLPAHVARSAAINDADEHARILGKFGQKYTAEWGTWGPRFEKGLADGSRVLLRYTPQ